ncbi:hypothetical protein [Oceaniglobus trochenteri]|uniref:hypothetical protein n=1 Tax=Oceaniglobus trochenteri TaxID=2763260 RepID=UPI001CFFBD29|nr:hypothetical protein [Oceaniglobus trochenteri]
MTTHADEIEIPIVEIAPGWTVDDIRTEDDCDDAFAYLCKAVTAIETRLEEMEEFGCADARLKIRTRSALRWKKAALTIVQTKRGQINRRRKEELHASRQRRLIDTIRDTEPEAFRRVLVFLGEDN